MNFIKIGSIVINVDYIAAVQLETQTLTGENSVSILLAIPKLSLLQLESIYPSAHHDEWFIFVGEEAQMLKDYFNKSEFVIDEAKSVAPEGFLWENVDLLPE